MLSMDALFTPVEPILKKRETFQHKSKFKFNLFESKIKFLGFHAVFVKPFPLMYQLLM